LTVPGETLQRSVLDQVGIHTRNGRIPNSYPSGHMLRFFLVLAALALALPNLVLRAAALVAGIFVAAILVLTRAHWPSDVIGGALLGWSMLAIAVLSAGFVTSRFPLGRLAAVKSELEPSRLEPNAGG
jgi:membrane-associated phospholipid phosphatase